MQTSTLVVLLGGEREKVCLHAPPCSVNLIIVPEAIWSLNTELFSADR